jgi:hypothetical protein
VPPGRRPAGARLRVSRRPISEAQANSQGLGILGLAHGERVRFRRRSEGRWQEGTVARRERDGSIGVTDNKGAARAIPIEFIEVRCLGPRGGSGWEPLTDRVARTEQLRLL